MPLKPEVINHLSKSLRAKRMVYFETSIETGTVPWGCKYSGYQREMAARLKLVVGCNAAARKTTKRDGWRWRRALIFTEHRKLGK